jgi:hypothetical protein
VATKLEGFNRHCPQITSLCKIACPEFKQIMGPPGILIPDHNCNVNIILQNCGDTDVYKPRGALLGNVKNLSINEPRLCKEQHLNAEKLQKQFDARARPLPEPLTPAEKNEFLGKAKINVPAEFQYQYEELLAKHHDVVCKHSQDIGKANHCEHNILLKKSKPRY